MKNFKWQYCEDDIANADINNSTDYNESMIDNRDYHDDRDINNQMDNANGWYNYYNEVDTEIEY